LFSPFSSFDGYSQRCSFPNQPNRDKISTRKFDVGVFTQPGSNREDLSVSKCFPLFRDSRHFWTVRLKGFGVVGEPVTLAHPTGIRTWGEFGLKLCLWRFTFLNYTKLTKYEALEKNAVSRQQIA
jgi:hypothetical protein